MKMQPIDAAMVVADGRWRQKSECGRHDGFGKVSL
jgi:hypothetical protein